jgi:hypothetical protein
MLLLEIAVTLMVAADGRAHTLPISYLYVLTDADYIHMELILNPFELSFFSELDQNKDGQLEPAELEAHKEMVTRQIVDSLSVKVNGNLIPAEVAGLTLDADSEHLAFRGHYRVDARRAALTIESSLSRISSASHLTQVTCLRNGQRHLAQLDLQSSRATFEVVEPTPPPALIIGRVRRAAPNLGPSYLLLAVPGMTLLAFAVRMVQKKKRTGTGISPGGEFHEFQDEGYSVRKWDSPELAPPLKTLDETDSNRTP